jgi:hypothetical protein
MIDILSLLLCFEQAVDKTTVKQLSRIALALLTMTGRVTMLGISRWTEKGGSYRTMQRFFKQVVPWATVHWLFVYHQLLRAGGEYIIAGDETVVTKAGKQTYGLDRFFSSIYGRPVPGLAIFALSLVNVDERQSYPLMVEQRVRSAEEKQGAKTKRKAKKATKPKGKPGRPKGCKQKDKTVVEWTPELLFIQSMLLRLVAQLAKLPVKYVVMDGHFGNNNALQMVRQATHWHLISKLRHDAALYFLYDGEQKSVGRHKRYGDKVNYSALPEKYLVKTAKEAQILTQTYQATMLHKSFAQPLNVVIVVKRNLVTGACAHVVLFSSDLTLTHDKLVDYYVLRFQLEFNFRDAKQFWGLEDFMNIKQVPVANAVNLAFFMCNLSQVLLRQLRMASPDCGILDLKALFRGRRYAVETLNLLPQKPHPFISNQIVHAVATLGSIHRHSRQLFIP